MSINQRPVKIILVAGAGPNFMKIAPLMHEFKNYPSIRVMEKVEAYQSFGMVNHLIELHK